MLRKSNTVILALFVHFGELAVKCDLSKAIINVSIDNKAVDADLKHSTRVILPMAGNRQANF
jgi:hypothetical protein